MSKTPKLRGKAAALYGVTAVLFVAFAIYMLLFARVSVFAPRESRGYETVTDYTEVIQPEEQAPAGVTRVFRWKLGEVRGNDDCVCCYLIHHYARVYLDGELVYSLQPMETNRIGKTVSSNWICIPVYPEDAGAEVTVVLTPVYSSVVNSEVEFLYGSRFGIFQDCLLKDADTLIISLICILVGLFIMGMQGVMLANKRQPSLDMFYLGNFTVIVGIWRITDTRVMAFLMPRYAMALGYITIAALVLCAVPLMLFMKERMADFDRAPLLHASIVLSLLALVMLALQVFGIADLREMLTICHIMLVGAGIMLVMIAVMRSRRMEGKSPRRSVVLVGLLGLGAAMDIVSYYWKGTSNNVVFLAIALVIFVVCLFLASVFETKTMAYTDPNTGLFNKNRWDVLMSRKVPVTGDVGVMMVDLNGLKVVNDTFGHETGDRMIFNFANILRNTLPPGSVICRWGGDEFSVMLMDADPEKMEQAVVGLHHAADAYNAAGNRPEIFFAAGWALASEFPDLPWDELLSQADERMYQDKRNWYSEHAKKE